jgi:hypothetical protein
MRGCVRTGKTIAVVLALAAWFLGHAWKGLTVYFQGDDAMNLYQAWVLPTWKILAANLTPFTTVYRPLGTAFYKLGFDLLGWHPLGFRMVAYLLMLANIGLLYRVAKLVIFISTAEPFTMCCVTRSFCSHCGFIYREAPGTYRNALSCFLFVMYWR